MQKVLSLIVFISILTSCAVNPVTGKKQISFMSEAQEIAMGQASDPSILSQFGLYQDDELQAFIEEKGQEMAAISHRSYLNFEFKVVDSDVVNAFAVPGGYVYFTRGIMAHFNNEAQFAGVLGHEIGHVAARHSAQQYTKQMITQVAFMGAMIASEKFRDFGQEAMMGMQLLFLKFSRSNEQQSDVLGVEYSSTVGYNSYEMADFFKTLDRMSGGGEGRLPEFYSTHPDPGTRYTDVRALTDKWRIKNGTTPTEVNRDGYLQMIDGIVYGEDPRQGYVENWVFYHPELEFQFPVPRDWKYQNSPSQFQMAPEDGNSLMMLMLSSKSTINEAVAEIKEQYKLTNVRGGARNINGLSGYGMVSDYPQEQDPSTGQTVSLAMQTVVIEHNDLIYVMHGLCAKEDFNKNENHFDKTMLGFKVLTDQSKINVVPERIKVVAANSSNTLQQVLAQHNIPSDRHAEFAILNGMELTDQLTMGTMVKIMIKSTD